MAWVLARIGSKIIMAQGVDGATAMLASTFFVGLIFYFIPPRTNFPFGKFIAVLLGVLLWSWVMIVIVYENLTKMIPFYLAIIITGALFFFLLLMLDLWDKRRRKQDSDNRQTDMH